MLDDLTQIALRLAPELSTAGFRVLEHQPNWLCHPRAAAYATYGRHFDIRDYLRSTGEWAGVWGSYVVIVPPLPDFSQACGLLVHELSHCLPARPTIVDDCEPSAVQRDVQTGQLMAWAATGSHSIEPWAGHGAEFIRRAVHLRHRAARLGIDIALADANVAGVNYGLSHPSEYETELATEPLRMMLKPFSEIDAEPIPPRFARLFCTDVAAWHFDRLTSPDTGDDRQ